MKLMMELEQFAVAARDKTPPPPLMLLMAFPVPEQPVMESKYKCTTCNKCFASHQALGTHRSSHNKTKITSTDHHHTEACDYESSLMNQSGENMEKEVKFAADVMVALGSNSNNGVHQCTSQEVEGTNLSKGNQSQKPNEALKLQPIPDSLKLPGKLHSNDTKLRLNLNLLFAN
ncbi:hypothetical protein L2E82_20434 [Cichorium intybus]|uniref:Uncharacterized protein n=1 Tax=Cichorium intybus TaxID=13427 RepID=A0ACB9DTM1_CICIN|nr:hypothetical protein L2E82_20434 [Cichorium intybus]